MAESWEVNNIEDNSGLQPNDSLTKLTLKRISREDEIVINSLKLRSRSLSIKRKSETQGKESNKKISRISRMDTNDINDIIEKTATATAEKVKADLKITDVLEEMKAVNLGLTRLSEASEQHEMKIEKLSNEMNGLRSEITEDIRQEMREELINVQNLSAKASLLKEIDKTSSNLILYGYKGEPNVEGIHGLFREMNVEDIGTIKVTKVSKLGLPKGGGPKVSPVHIILGDMAQRNKVLKAGSGLPSGISMERDIPHPYRAAYKRFKKHAWKIKALHGVHTQIVFNEHILTLRYREDGKSFTIIDEWHKKNHITKRTSF